MKKAICLILALAAAISLCACGAQTFRCDLCMKEVTQRPHEATFLGQEIQICDDCCDELDSYGLNID